MGRFTKEERLNLEAALDQMMSNWSESRYAAGWLIGLEDFLPFTIKKEMEAGYENNAGMWGIAKMLGHWLDGDGNPYTPKGFTFDLEQGHAVSDAAKLNND
jgi:hypothetical protein